MSVNDQLVLLERYRRLNELSRDLASTLDLNILLDRIAHSAHSLCHAEAASILLYDQKKQELYFETMTNKDLPDMKGMVVPVEGSIAGWIVKNSQPLIITDAQNDPRHYNGVKDATQIETQSLLGVPLIAKDRVIGVLETINKRDGDFDDEDQDLLMALGAVAAVAIVNARLFQQSDLISELVHELRTPLTSLNTASTLMLNPQLSEDARTELQKLMLGETKRLSEMTTNFLDLARLESGRMPYQMNDFEIKFLLEESVQLMQARAAEMGLQLQLDIPDGLPLLRGDRGKIKQVMINLLSNAIKYNKPSGMVIVNVAAEGEDLVVRVRDTGVGIPAKSVPLLFTKFYRVPGTEQQAQGTGLGLSITKRIIEDHGGRIKVQSRVGEGTTFIVYLPIS